MGLIELLVDYHRLRTYSPPVYAMHVAIQLLGHSFGWGSCNRQLPPRGVNHNMYLVLLGQSGRTKKTTAQMDTIGSLYPPECLGPTNFSPEALLSELNDKPQLMCQLVEFSLILRSMKYGGYMANFKEFTNDLFTRRVEYSRKLRNVSFALKKPYLSLCTTCTEEAFFDNLTSEEVYGGFLPRWLLVHSDAPLRREITLPENIDEIESALKRIVFCLYGRFHEVPLQFSFSKEAMKGLNEIQQEWEDDPKYEAVQPFVSRYIEYLVKYADVICLSDVIVKGEGQSNLTKFTELPEFTELIELTSTIKTNKFITSMDSIKPVTSVNTVHLDMAKKMILPCLDYARKVVSTVGEERDIAAVLRVLNEKKMITRGELLQRTHLNSQKLNMALGTLSEREEVKWEDTWVGTGQAKKRVTIVRRIDA